MTYDTNERWKQFTFEYLCKIHASIFKEQTFSFIPLKYEQSSYIFLQPQYTFYIFFQA